MSNNAILLQMKRAAGLATPEELAVLDEMPVITGNGLATPRPPADVAAWAARYGGERLLEFSEQPEAADGYPVDGDATRKPEKGSDGFYQCAPGDEPGHPDKPRTFRPIDLTQPRPLTMRERYIRDVRRS